MKIILESPINRYYVQTLCMIFFPGEHFGQKENEIEDENIPVLFLRTAQDEKGIHAYPIISSLFQILRLFAVILE